MSKNIYREVSGISGDDTEDTELLLSMSKNAQDYIKSFAWCPPISGTYFAYGVGGVVAVFQVEFAQKIKGTDDKLWIVVGDLPSAYLVVERVDDPGLALERYCELMDQWVVTVRKSGDFRDVYPVAVEPTLKNAESLNRRIDFLRTEVIPRIAVAAPL
jgi:hypothetical protein